MGNLASFLLWARLCDEAAHGCECHLTGSNSNIDKYILLLIIFC
jgi:hypothetical protein